MPLELSNVELKEIGRIYSPFKEAKGTPIQSTAHPRIEGKIEVFPEFAEGLKDLEGFSHLILIYFFDRAAEVGIPKKKLKVVPYMDSEAHGLFATRAPSRPNRIGFSVVELKKRDENILYITGVDILNNTPLLDIKPYVPQFDIPDPDLQNIRIGWLEGKVDQLNLIHADGRFQAPETPQNP